MNVQSRIAIQRHAQAAHAAGETVDACHYPFHTEEWAVWVEAFATAVESSEVA